MEIYLFIFRWCMSLNFIELTGFVVWGHMWVLYLLYCVILLHGTLRSCGSLWFWISFHTWAAHSVSERMFLTGRVLDHAARGSVQVGVNVHVSWRNTRSTGFRDTEKPAGGSPGERRTSALTCSQITLDDHLVLLLVSSGDDQRSSLSWRTTGTSQTWTQESRLRETHTDRRTHARTRTHAQTQTHHTHTHTHTTDRQRHTHTHHTHTHSLTTHSLTHTHTHTHSLSLSHTILSHTHTHTHTLFSLSLSHTHSLSLTHTHTHTERDTHARTNAHTSHTHTHTHTQTHPHTHTLSSHHTTHSLSLSHTHSLSPHPHHTHLSLSTHTHSLPVHFLAFWMLVTVCTSFSVCLVFFSADLKASSQDEKQSRHSTNLQNVLSRCPPGNITGLSYLTAITYWKYLPFKIKYNYK